MQGKDSYGGRVALQLQAPRLLSRIIEIPKKNKVTEITFINLSSLIEAHATSIFPGMEILGIFQFRVTRNSDLYVDDEEVTDLRQALKEAFPKITVMQYALRQTRQYLVFA